MSRRVVVGFSGGVSSAWCAGWALREFPRDEIVLLFHDTMREHQDTYRFICQMAATLDLKLTERSDGRSVVQVFRDEHFLGNNQNAMCSRILKTQQGEAFVRGLLDQGHEVVRVFGFSGNEPRRMQRLAGAGMAAGYSVRFPLAEESVTKQQAADWVASLGICPPAIYEHFEHANCIGCVKGGRAYWLKVAEHYPAVFEEMAQLEDEFGHTIIRGGDREHPTLRQLVKLGLKRTVNQREHIEIGACECGD